MKEAVKHFYRCLVLVAVLTACATETPKKTGTVAVEAPASKIYAYTDYLTDNYQTRILVRNHKVDEAVAKIGQMQQRLQDLPAVDAPEKLAELKVKKEGILSSLFIPVDLNGSQFPLLKQAITESQRNTLEISELRIGEAQIMVDSAMAQMQLSEATRVLQDKTRTEAVHRSVAADRSLRNATGVVGNVNQFREAGKPIVHAYIAAGRLLEREREYTVARDVMKQAQAALEAYKIRHSPDATQDRGVTALEEEIAALEKTLDEKHPSLINKLSKKVGGFFNKLVE